MRRRFQEGGRLALRAGAVRSRAEVGDVAAQGLGFGSGLGGGDGAVLAVGGGVIVDAPLSLEVCVNVAADWGGFVLGRGAGKSRSQGDVFSGGLVTHVG